MMMMSDLFCWFWLESLHRAGNHSWGGLATNAVRYGRVGLCFERASLGVTVRRIASLNLFRLELTRIDKLVAVERGVLGRGYYLRDFARLS